MRFNKLGIFLLLFLTLCIPLTSGAVGGLSEATIRSNFFGFEKAWIVDFVSDGFTTDRIDAFFTPSDFEDESGTATKQSLRISAKTRPTSCEWSLKEDTSSNPDIYEYEPITDSEWFWNENVNTVNQRLASEMGCAILPGTSFEWKAVTTFGAGKTTVWCVKINEKLATVGQFKNKFTRAETDWTVTAEGKSPQKATISNSDIGDGKSSSIGDRVFVQWQGFAGTGKSCPLTEDSIPIHSNNFNDGWKVASRGNYDSYARFHSQISDKIGDWSDGRLTTENFRSQLSSFANGAIQSDSDFGGFRTISSSVSNGKISVDLGEQIVYPQFRLIIDADYLELDIPSGEPELSKDFLGKCLPGKEVKFTEGSAGILKVEANNIGEGEGGFNVRVVSCSNGFSSSTPSRELILDEGDSKIIDFQIIGSTTQNQAKLTGSCTIEMKESLTQETDTCVFDTELTQIRECPPPEFSCGVNDAGFHTIRECNSQGTGLDLIETCLAGEVCRPTLDGAECKLPGDDTGFVGDCPPIFGVIPNVFCMINDLIEQARVALAIIIGFLAALISGVMANNLSKKQSKKTRTIIVISVALVIGIILGILAYLYFWAIVAVVIVLGIIKWLVPGV